MSAEAEGSLHADDLVDDRTNLGTLRSLESISFVSHVTSQSLFAVATDPTYLECV